MSAKSTAKQENQPQVCPPVFRETLVGDAFRCDVCGQELQVVTGRTRSNAIHDVICCGQAMRRLAEDRAGPQMSGPDVPLDAVQEASEESFPASDPPAHTPVTGVKSAW